MTNTGIPTGFVLYCLSLPICIMHFVFKGQVANNVFILYQATLNQAIASIHLFVHFSKSNENSLARGLKPVEDSQYQVVA